MRRVAYGSVLLAALGVFAACGSDDEEPASGGKGGSGTGGSGGAATVTCGANPQPGDTCSANGTCQNATNCFCLSGSISCSNGPSTGNGGEPNNGGGDVDCGNDPSPGDPCDEAGQCSSDDDCFCDGDEVQGFNCGSDFGGGGFPNNGDTADCGRDPEDGDSCSGGPGLCEGTMNCVCFDDEVNCF